MPPGVVLFLQVIPLGIGVAVIPTVIGAQLLLLAGGTAGLPRAWALAVGRMIGLALMSVLGLSWLTQLPSVGRGLPTVWEAVIFTVAGVALLAVAVLQFRHRSRPEADKPAQPSRMRTMMNRGSVWLVFGLSLGWLIFTVQVYALYIPALHLITNSSAWFVWQVLSFVVLFLLASSTVLAPVLAVSLRGAAVLPTLDRIHDWIDSHSRQITVVVAGVFGIVLLGVGLWEFSR